MTLRELICANNEYGETDITEIYTDSFLMTYDGEKLSEKGRQFFKSALDLPIEMKDGECKIIVDNYEELKAVEHLFNVLNGYCSDNEYKKYVERAMLR